MQQRKNYKSDDEYYFALWLECLKQQGYVSYWAYELEVTHILPNMYAQFKTRKSEKPTKRLLFRGMSYTPDFTVYFTQKAVTDGILHVINGESYYEDFKKSHIISLDFTDIMVDGSGNKHYITYIELKPKYDQRNMTRVFKDRQKTLYYIHNKYVCLIKGLDELFKDTFAPKEYLTTKSGKPRKGAKEYKSLNQWQTKQESTTA